MKNFRDFLDEFRGIGVTVTAAVALVTIGLTLLPLSSEPSAIAAPSDSVMASDPTSLQPVLERRLERYASGLDRMYSNLKLQVLFVILAIMIAMTNAKKFQIPIVDGSVPVAMLYLVVPVALLFLWTEFGHVLDSLIEERVALWMFLDLLGDPRGDSPLTQRQLLNDRGLLDLYFVSFHPGLAALKDSPQWLNRLVLGAFGAFLGVGHGAIASTAYIGAVRSNRASSKRNGGRAFKAFLFAAVAFLIFTHIQFAFVGHHPNWVHHVVALSGLGCFWGFAWIEWLKSRP